MNPTLVAALSLVLLVKMPAASGPGPALEIPDLSDKAIADFKAATSDADAAIAAKQSDKALRAFRRAVAIHRTNEGVWYNFACTFALAGRTDEALDALGSASAAGWADPTWPTKDSDLASLQELPAFASWLDSLQPGPRTAALDVGGLAPDADAISKLADEASARLERLRGVLGSTETMRETRRIATWRALSWDRVAAGREGAAATEARMEALRALTRKDFWPRGPEFADEVLRRATSLADASPDSDHAATAELIAALAANQVATAAAAANAADGDSNGSDDDEGDDELDDADDAEEDLRDRLLVLAASHDDGPAVRAALVKLLASSEDPRASRRLYSRLARLVPDATERKALVMDGARGAWFRMEGLPAFEARTLDGQSLSPGTLKGKVTLVDFWATWCGPCKAELPEIKLAWERFQRDDFQIIGVSLDKAADGDPAAFTKWCAENGVAWPQVFDGKHWDSALAKTFGVRSIPFPLLLDRSGRVIAADEQLRGDELIPAIEGALLARGTRASPAARGAAGQ